MTKGIGWKKNQQIQIHPLIPLYTYYHMWLRYNYVGHNWGQMMCYHMSPYLII